MGIWGPDSPVDDLFDYDNDGELDFFETSLRDSYLSESDDTDDYDDDDDDYD